VLTRSTTSILGHDKVFRLHFDQVDFYLPEVVPATATQRRGDSFSTHPFQKSVLLTADSPASWSGLPISPTPQQDPSHLLFIDRSVRDINAIAVGIRKTVVDVATTNLISAPSPITLCQEAAM
jgi:hypothetical protein